MKYLIKNSLYAEWYLLSVDINGIQLERVSNISLNSAKQIKPDVINSVLASNGYCAASMVYEIL